MYERKNISICMHAFVFEYEDILYVCMYVCMYVCVYLRGSMMDYIMNAQWSPCGRYLWAGGRASSELSCWDLRQTREKVGSVERDLQVGQQVIIIKCYYY